MNSHNVSQILRAARRRAGLTQAGMAARLGVPVRTLRSWEQGTRRPTAVTWRLLQRELDITT